MKKFLNLLLVVVMLTATTFNFSFKAPVFTAVKATTSQKLSAVNNLHAFYQYSSQSSFKDIQQYFKNLKSVSFPWAKLEYVNGVYMNKTMGKNSNYDYFFPNNFITPLSYAKQAGVQTQLSVFANIKTCNAILPDSTLRKNAINSIMASLDGTTAAGTQYSFDGVVIDFEGLCDKDNTGKTLLIKGLPISKYLNVFLQELKLELNKDNKKLFTAVPPKGVFDGYDYKSILKTSDKVILMAHDFEPKSALSKSDIQRFMKYSTKNPINSLAPIKQVKIALSELTRGESSLTRSKIILQINFDIGQWQFNNLSSAKEWTTLPSNTMSGPINKPTYKTLKDRLDSIEKFGAYYSTSYINELESPYLAYYNSGNKSYNFILFENSRSIGAKIDAAKKYGVNGISIWKLDNMPNYLDSTGIKYKLNIW